MTNPIEENLQIVLQKIKSHSDSAKLLAVSKLHPSESIKKLHDAGQKHFGENYVQELTEKMEALKDLGIQWHFIGRLQKNKVKYIIGKVFVIESVDSIELAETINKEAIKKNCTQNIFLQFNLGEESTKGGFSPKTTDEELKKVLDLTHVNVLGCMILPPLFENPDDSRPYFNQLRKLLDHIKTINSDSRHKLTELSMGTSHDYQIALEEGATWIRVGTALFGERPK